MTRTGKRCAAPHEPSNTRDVLASDHRPTMNPVRSKAAAAASSAGSATPAGPIEISGQVCRARSVLERHLATTLQALHLFGSDSDLAILLTQARQCSVALLGPPADSLFEPVPAADLRKALAAAAAPGRPSAACSVWRASSCRLPSRCARGRSVHHHGAAMAPKPPSCGHGEVIGDRIVFLHRNLGG